MAMAFGMTAVTSICRNCGKEGFYARNCWKNKEDDKNKSAGVHDEKQNKKYSWDTKAGAKGDTGQKWCSVHKTTFHSDKGCYEQGAPHPERGGAHLASVPSAGSPRAATDK